MVTVFSKNNCIQCKMTKRFLEEHNVAFIEHNIDEQPEFIENLRQKAFWQPPSLNFPTVMPSPVFDRIAFQPWPKGAAKILRAATPVLGARPFYCY